MMAVASKIECNYNDGALIFGQILGKDLTSDVVERAVGEEIKVLTRCEEAVLEYRMRHENNKGKKIELAEGNGCTLRAILRSQGVIVPADSQIDVYNPSRVFVDHGKEYLAVRIEPSGKNSEHESVVAILQRNGGIWEPRRGRVFKLQDPNVVWIGGEMVLSGVELFADENGKMSVYRNVFYRGKNLDSLERFAKGPLGMKGIRLVQIDRGTIGVYTRPQGEKGGRGQIGFTTISSLEELTAEVINNAPLLNDRFPYYEWGGVNEARLLRDGRIFDLGHRAYEDRFGKHYYPWAFVHDLVTGRIIDLGILAERRDFPRGQAKAWDLEDVLYTSSLTTLEIGTGDGARMLLIVGLSDTEAGVIEIDDPLRRLPRK